MDDSWEGSHGAAWEHQVVFGAPKKVMQVRMVGTIIELFAGAREVGQGVRIG